MQYDKNGNILSLTRNGMSGGTPAAPGFGVIDQLTYTYRGGSTTNKLFSVSDTIRGNVEAGDFKDGNTIGDDYDYYADGSLKSDKNKGITSILYNSLGLVETVVLKKKINGELDATTCQIDYLYDGSGRKWQKKARTYKEQVTSGPLPLPKTAYTYYGQGIQFESDEAAGTTNALSHILHEEGRIIKDPQSGQLAYEYHYADHLGNLRVAFRQQTPVTSQATLSFEPQHAAQEEAAFEKVTGNRAAGIAREGRYAARLLREAGPGKTVRLSEGETLKASVFAYFEQPKHKRTTWLPLPIFDQQSLNSSSSTTTNPASTPFKQLPDFDHLIEGRGMLDFLLQVGHSYVPAADVLQIPIDDFCKRTWLGFAGVLVLHSPPFRTAGKPPVLLDHLLAVIAGENDVTRRRGCSLGLLVRPRTRVREIKQVGGDGILVAFNIGEKHDAARDPGIDADVVPASLVEIIRQVADALKVWNPGTGCRPHDFIEAEVVYHASFCDNALDDHWLGIGHGLGGHGHLPGSG